MKSLSLLFSAVAISLLSGCVTPAKQKQPAAQAAAGKPSGKTPSSVHTATGSFLGIDQGDYFYWNMRTEAGKQISLRIGKSPQSTQAVLDKPESYVGKKCRIQWKDSLKFLPEAGGKEIVSDILSVEWLGKK